MDFITGINQSPLTSHLYQYKWGSSQNSSAFESICAESEEIRQVYWLGRQCNLPVPLLLASATLSVHCCCTWMTRPNGVMASSEGELPAQLGLIRSFPISARTKDALSLTYTQTLKFSQGLSYSRKKSVRQTGSHTVVLSPGTHSGWNTSC